MQYTAQMQSNSFLGVRNEFLPSSDHHRHATAGRGGNQIGMSSHPGDLGR